MGMIFIRIGDESENLLDSYRHFCIICSLWTVSSKLGHFHEHLRMTMCRSLSCKFTQFKQSLPPIHHRSTICLCLTAWDRLKFLTFLIPSDNNNHYQTFQILHIPASMEYANIYGHCFAWRYVLNVGSRKTLLQLFFYIALHFTLKV